MKQKLLLYLAFMLLTLPALNAQIFVVEAMDGGVPGGWTQSGYSSSTLTPCEGSAGVRDNLWSSSTSGFLQTPTQTSNGSDVAVSFDWQATDFFGDPVDFTTIVDYTIDGGTTYTQIGTYGATAVTACTNFSTTILAADVPNGVDFNLRITANWNSGDHYHYVDNVSVTQMVSTPPNCDAALTSALVDFPLDGTLTWSAATGAPDDYLLTVGTTSGGSDIVASTATGGTSFDLSAAGLAYSTTYFVTITPTNANGSATGCTEESFVTEDDPNQAFTVDCTAGATNTTYCYGNADVSTFSYTSSDGTSGLELTFNAGEIEDGFDFITIYDGTDNTGTVLYTGDNGGDLTGVVAAGGTSIFMEVSSDGSVSCGQGSFTVNWDWDVVCTACVPASATGTAAIACPLTTASIDVVITDLGSATALSISNSLNATVLPATAAGTVNVPGFMLGDGTVTITVADAADATCSTTFDVEIPAACPPDNDACANAAAIACGDIDVAGTTTAATDDNPETCNFAGDGASGGVWYTWVGDGSEITFTVNADPGNADDLGDSQLAVYSGACGALVCETGNDDNTPPGGSGSQVTFLSVVGTTYYFYVDGWSANSGDFLVSLECTTCIGATATGSPVFTCPGTDVSIDVDLTDLGSASAVNITNSGNATSVPAMVADIYNIPGFMLGDGTITITITDQVDPTCVTTFDVAIPGECPPENNECVNATTVIDGQVVTGSTISATNVENLAPCERGGGDGDCTLGGTGTTDFTEGVWFVYTSTSPQNITVSTEGSAFDTEIMVFEGPCGALTCVGGDDDNGASNTSIFCWLSTATEAPVDYYIYVDGHNGATGDFELSILSTALPVELLSFDGKAMEKENLLSWSTASEQNTEWHIIERSLDGRTNWTEVGRVAAAGNSSVVNNYELKDESPITDAYYRLTSLDFDLYMDYSDVINIKRDVASGNIKVYPNPVNLALNLDFALQEAEDVIITVTDLTGKTISVETYQGARGNNNHTIDFSGLSNGVYFVSMVSNAQKTTKRVIKH